MILVPNSSGGIYAINRQKKKTKMDRKIRMINAKIDSCVVLIDSVLFFEAKSFHERRTKFSSKELGAQNKL